MAIPYIGTWNNTPPGGVALPFREPSNVPPVLRPNSPSGVVQDVGYIILSSGPADRIILSQGGFLLYAGATGMFTNTAPGSVAIPGITADNTPPVPHAQVWVAADNTAPGGRAVSFPPADNTAPLPAPVPVPAGIGPADNSRPVGIPLGGAMSNVPPVSI